MSTEIATQEQVSPVVQHGLREYSSIKAETFDDRKRILKAVTNAEPLKSVLKKKIAVQHVIQQVVEPQPKLNEATGEIEQERPYLRTTLIAADGAAFTASSKGIDNSLETAFKVLGTPDKWDEPVEFVVMEEGSGTRKFLTLTIA